MGKRIDGIDLSHYQGHLHIDWPVAKNAGVRFVYHKATEGTTWTDEFYHSRREHTKEAGVVFGAYHFAHPALDNAVAEAEHFLKFAAPLPGDLLPALDLEVNENHLSEDELTAWVNTFFGVVFRYIGVQRGVLYTHFNLGKKPGYVRLWVARYNNDDRAPIVPSPFQHWAIWQFSDGKYGDPLYVPGVGHVDINTLHWPPYGWASLNALRIPARSKQGSVPHLNYLDPANYPPAGPDHGPQITWLGNRLIAHGFNHYGDADGYQAGPTFTKYDRENTAAFQRAQGWSGTDANGYPGPETLKRLAAAPSKKRAPETAIGRLLRIAGSQVGYHEGFANGHWDNHQKYSPQVPGLEWSQDQPWCATFVSWCAMKAGLTSYFPRTASVVTAMNWWKGKHQFHEYPAVGAQVIYGGGEHTGIVYRYDADYIYTVEGNTNTNGSAEGDGVYRKKRLRRDPYVTGYGYPAVPGGLKSADPNYTRSH